MGYAIVRFRGLGNDNAAREANSYLSNGDFDMKTTVVSKDNVVLIIVGDELF